MRAKSGNLVFKISTTPYGHRTYQTNADTPLDVGHDFDFVYIDQDPWLQASRSGRHFKFESDLFAKRAKQGRGLVKKLNDPSELLGMSPLLESVDDLSTKDINKFIARLKPFAGDKLIARANRLKTSPKDFRNQIYRKVAGAVRLREALSRKSGASKLSIYAGAPMAMRASDANPRRFIRILNKLMQEGHWSIEGAGSKRKVRPIPAEEQTDILRSFSVGSVNRVRAEPVVGIELFQMLNRFGRAMSFNLHHKPMTSDQISSVKVNPSTSDLDWDLIRAGVNLGLLFPNVNYGNPDELPDKDGQFRIAYVLSPAFNLLPRRGKARTMAWFALHQRDVDSTQLLLLEE
jgi:hypothetical protein